jgi:hypothetical protein
MEMESVTEQVTRGWKRRPRWGKDLSNISDRGLTERDTCHHIIGQCKVVRCVK